jgi:hypothetical protein
MTLRAGKPPASARHRRHGEDDGRIYFDSSPLSCAVTANIWLSFFVACGMADRDRLPWSRIAPPSRKLDPGQLGQRSRAARNSAGSKSEANGGHGAFPDEPRDRRDKVKIRAMHAADASHGPGVSLLCAGPPV